MVIGGPVQRRTRSGPPGYSRWFGMLSITLVGELYAV